MRRSEDIVERIGGRLGNPVIIGPLPFPVWRTCRRQLCGAIGNGICCGQRHGIGGVQIPAGHQRCYGSVRCRRPSTKPGGKLRGIRQRLVSNRRSGLLDEAGYLRLTGRLKEIINRGGEKISPLEVEAALVNHPAIAQVIAFALPHSKLGEEVAVAVVLHPGVTLGEHELKDFARGRLAGFKVPRKVVFLTEMPLGSTGKLQRRGLAGLLGLTK